MKNKLIVLSALTLLCAFNSQISTVRAQGTAFTYQGRLNNASGPATGSYDLTFTLFGSNTAGTAIAGPVTNSATAGSNGLFAVTVDFGANFPGANRWLELGVRTNGGGAFSTLVPRQAITPTPYAITAGNVSGTVTAAQLPASVPVLTANGNLLVSPAQGNTIDPNAQQSTLAGGYANIMGNDDYAVIGGGAFNQIGLGGSGSVIPGGIYNIVGPGIYCAFAAGYQAQANYSGDFVWADFHNAAFTATAPNQFLIRAGGGVGININNPGTNALSVVGSVSATSFSGDGSGLTNLNISNLNLTNNNASLLTSGTIPDARLSANVAVLDTNSSLAVDQADGNSAASSYNSVVSGGNFDTIANSYNSFLGGGLRNSIVNAGYSFLGGGHRNTNSGYYSLLGGGRTNNIGANAYYAVIPGGLNNSVGANTLYAFAAGFNAQANHDGAFVWADSQSTPFASAAANQFLIRASGGVGIGTASPVSSLGYPSSWTGLHINAGAGNNCLGIIEGAVSSRLHLRNDGGIANTTQDFVMDSGNGDNNVDFRWLGSGLANRVNIMSFDQNGNVGIGTTTPGANNKLSVAGNASVSGTATVTNNGYGFIHTSSDGSSQIASYVNTSGAASFGTTTPNNLVLMAGGISAAVVAPDGSFNANSIFSQSVDVQGEIYCTAINILSDRDAKEQFKPVNTLEVLDQVVGLPITEWQYKNKPDTRHIGPMAQDFHAAFSLGHDEKHITTVDEDGVALAAIQGLNQKLEAEVKEKDARINDLAAKLASMEARFNAFEKAASQNAGNQTENAAR